MENQLTTTFIPKKPLMETPETGSRPTSRPVGFLSAISTILFLVTLALCAGVYFWKQYETSTVATLATSVTKVEKTFEPELITQLQILDRQLRDANGLLQNHTVLTPLFNALEASTLKQVRFNKFDVSFDPLNGTLVKMSGDADGYRTIAQESDVLGANTYLKNVLFSNFSLTQTGRVSFDLSFSLSPDFTSFVKAPIVTDANNIQTSVPITVQSTTASSVTGTLGTPVTTTH